MDEPELPGDFPDSIRGEGEDRIFSFIVKVFLEPHPRHKRNLRWRGNLTFVSEGEVRAVNSLGILILALYQRLEQKGVWFHPFYRGLLKIYQFITRTGW